MPTSNRTRINDLLSVERLEDAPNPVVVNGWVKTVRSSGGVSFRADQ